MLLSDVVLLFVFVTLCLRYTLICLIGFRCLCLWFGVWLLDSFWWGFRFFAAVWVL